MKLHPLLLLLFAATTTTFHGLGCGHFMVQAQDQRHLCDKVMSGHFDRITFKSISYDSDRDMLVLFEGDRQYLVPNFASLPANHSQLQVGAYMGWKDGEVGRAVKELKLSSAMKAVFFLESRQGIWMAEKNFKTRYGVNVLTEDAEYMAAYWYLPLVSAWKTMWTETRRVHPDYTLVTEMSRWGTLGWVIHKDIYDHQLPFIVYDLNDLTWWKMELEAIQRFDAPPAVRAAAPYFYLEKSESPSEVVLVHREHITAAREEDVSTRRPNDRRIRSLFSLPPVGYRHRGYVYLMDVAIGCVYVISDFGYLDKSFAAKPAKDQFRHRRNIPYEEFFSCDARLYPPAPDLATRQPANRCQTVYDKFPIPVTLLVDRYSTPATFAILAAVVSLFLLCLLIGCYVKYCTGELPPGGEEEEEEEEDAATLKKAVATLVQQQQQDVEKAKAVGKKKKKTKTPKTDKEALHAFRQHKQPKKAKKEGEEKGGGETEERTAPSSSPSPSTTPKAITDKKTDNTTTTTTTSSTKKKKQTPTGNSAQPKPTMSMVL